MLPMSYYDNILLYNFVYIVSYNSPFMRVQNVRALVEGYVLSAVGTETPPGSVAIYISGLIFGPDVRLYAH